MQTKVRITLIIIALLLQVAVYTAMDKWACYDCNTQRITYGLLLMGNLLVLALALIAVRKSGFEVSLWIKLPSAVLSVIAGFSSVALLMWLALPILRYQ